MITRGRLIAGVTLATVGALVCTATLRSIAATRQAELDASRVSSQRALADAVATDAQRWAPGPLAEAQDALQAALISERIQQASLRPLPNFAEAHAHLAFAAAAAARAAATSEQRKESARQEARTGIDTVGQSVERHAALAPALGADARRSAARARLALDEASLYYDGGDYELALARVAEANELAQVVSVRATAIGRRYGDAGQLARWRRLADDTVAWSRRTGGAAIVVSKAEHRLTLYVGGRAQRRYHVDLSPNWLADKAHAGDDAVPEGRYRVTRKKGRGHTRYHKALLLDYPNDADRRAFSAAKRDGRLAASARIGGLIEIHGDGGQARDWTDGCVALTNAEMDQLFARVAVGTPVTIIGAGAPHALDDLAPASPGTLSENRQ